MKKYLQLLIVTMFITACSSPQKSFEKGNYKKAYRAALKNIKKGKKSRKDRTILNRSFNELIKQKSDIAETHLNSDIIEDWERGYAEYEELIDLFYDGKVYLDEDFDRQMAVIETSNDALGKDLAINYFELGNMSMEGFMDTYNKGYAQEAFAYYTKTRHYDDGYARIDSLLDDAFNKGVILILVEADAPFERSYEWEIDRKFSDIERESSGFNQIVYEGMVEADCVLEIDFSSLDRDIRESRSVENFQERTEDGYETRVDTSGNTIKETKYRNIEGTVTTIAESISYSWRVAVNVRGNRGYCDFRNRNFNEEVTVVNERYQLSGDDRAIPSRYKRDNNSRDVDEDDMVEDLLDELYREISNYYF